MIFRGEAGPHASLRFNGFGVEDDDARHGVGAVHQGCRSFKDLHLPDGLPVQFKAVLIAPLLSLLAYAVGHGDDAIVA